MTLLWEDSDCAVGTEAQHDCITERSECPVLLAILNVFIHFSFCLKMPIKIQKLV